MLQPKKKKCNGCGEVTVIWKSEGREKYCKQCWSCHKTSGVRQTSAKKRTALSPRSPKQRRIEAAYNVIRKAYLDSLPLQDCEYCSATGIRNDEHVKGTCNACHGSGQVKSWATEYPFDVDNVIQFQEFLDNCGGFSIH